MSLLLCSMDGGQCLLLTQEVTSCIVQYATKWHPLETGGILLGHYDSNGRLATVHVAGAPPPDSKHGLMTFVRGIIGVAELVEWGAMQSSPLHYVGEWHTHPSGNPKPSNTDRQQMYDFVQQGLYGVRTPILLVIGGTPVHKLKWQAAVFGKDDFYVSLNLL
ncbi:Mov34/MPN/PAD-1 family protein [Spirosoma sp. KNUC1025]|uniref:Mov34/MPN/PAD-1 family protein n=1 Tax=Spirosoma sp. KNUC1025 TaxID=2894082 RepID=UPI0038636CA6|nr:Mov34/MPN/PAD-1 family protein [Spirosoma sp. KNUC1025]